MRKRLVYQTLAAGLLFAGNARADIVWSGEQNLSGYEQYIDLNFDSKMDVLLAYEVYSGDEFYPDRSSAILKAYIDIPKLTEPNQILVNASSNRNAALPYGTLIADPPDASLEWKGGLFASGRVGDWSTFPEDTSTGAPGPPRDTEWNGLLGETGEAYLGIAFDIEGSTHYGWVHVALGEINPEYGFEDPITASWAYESTPGAPIAAGAIPEPSTGLLTLVGAAGLLYLRRARRYNNACVTMTKRKATEATELMEEW